MLLNLSPFLLVNALYIYAQSNLHFLLLATGDGTFPSIQSFYLVIVLQYGYDCFSNFELTQKAKKCTSK